MTLENLLILLAMTVIVLVIGFIAVPYLKSKGLLNKESVNTTQQLLEMVKIVLQNLKTGNEDFKSDTETVFSITQKVVLYIDQTMTSESNESKKDYALKTTLTILEDLGIQVNDSMEQLIEIGIESAVNALKQNK